MERIELFSINVTKLGLVSIERKVKCVMIKFVINIYIFIHVIFFFFN